MANLMNRQKQVLVCSCADNVCGAPEAEGPEWCVLQAVGGEYLDGNDEDYEVFCEGLWPAELSYLRTSPLASIHSIDWERREKVEYFRMRFNNSHSPRPVRLLRICPEEIMFLDLETRGCLSLWRAS
jgi:hypothetical protein